MKVRLYKGPFSGKVYECPEAGRNTIIIADYKKMSRKARYEAEVEYYRTGAMTFGERWKPPIIQAEYQICTTVRPMVGPVLTNGVTSHVSAVAPIMRGILMHPDGSIFYEWTGKKKEIPYGRRCIV